MRSAVIAILFFTLLTQVAFIAGTDAGSKEDYVMEYKSIESRFYDYMSNRKLSKQEDIYKMLTPAIREKYTFDEFERLPKRTPNIVTYNLKLIDIQENKAKVYYNELTMGGGVLAPQMKSDQYLDWIKLDGIWYLDLQMEHENMTGPGCGGSKKEQSIPDSVKSGCGNRAKKNTDSD